MVERDVLLGVLAVSAGSADGWSFFGLGHAFVANMTGNTVFLGMSIFQKHGDPLHFLISLACYAAGVITGSLLTRNIQAESNSDLWPHAVSRTLLLEALLLVLAEAGWITTRIASHTFIEWHGTAHPTARNRRIRHRAAERRHAAVEDPRNRHHLHFRHLDNSDERPGTSEKHASP